MGGVLGGVGHVGARTHAEEAERANGMEGDASEFYWERNRWQHKLHLKLNVLV